MQAATNILVTMNLVGMGLGMSIVPRYVCHFQSSSVVFRPLPQIELLMAWHKETVWRKCSNWWQTRALY
ncbi:hypothetical protein BMI79_04135 [Serratia oryzae]|uniref:LysR substrate-binding domain-containing protein n=1 Tax=Serratia oryzae TaxID=2034155 RepID=A0A1S8CMQ7_9GAMM|nr:hypothetical protein BMI79_04135 [Serratia oryzae]